MARRTSCRSIWLGYRCSSSSSPASYGHLIYSKGAYVLHMLRNTLHDYRTGSDERFAALMRDYVSSHAHRRPQLRISNASSNDMSAKACSGSSTSGSTVSKSRAMNTVGTGSRMATDGGW